MIISQGLFQAVKARMIKYRPMAKMHIKTMPVPFRFPSIIFSPILFFFYSRGSLTAPSDYDYFNVKYIWAFGLLCFKN